MSECEHKDFIFIGKKSRDLEVSWCRDCGAIRDTKIMWSGRYKYDHKQWGLPASYSLLKTEVSELKYKLNEAVKLLKEGKRQFTPNTTNSTVDDFIERHSK